MEKLLIAFCFLGALAGIPRDRGENGGAWRMRLRAGTVLRVDLRVDSSHPLECVLIVHGQLLSVIYTSHRCLGRSCHA